MKAKDIFKKLMDRQPVLSGKPGDMAKRQIASRASRIAEYLDERGKRIDEDCTCCWTRKASSDYPSSVYDTPWDDEPRDVNFCSEECEIAYLYEGDFRYFYCNHCNRQVCEQNPCNGHHIQYRDDYSGEPLCLKCYEELVLEKGILEVEEEKFENGQIPGMFHDTDELEDMGWEEDEEFRTASSADTLKRLKELDEQGFKATVSYYSLSILGDGGVFSIWKKRKNGCVVPLQ